MCWHEWSKWEKVDTTSTIYDYSKPIPVYKPETTEILTYSGWQMQTVTGQPWQQERHCSKCGRYQRDGFN